MPELPEVETTRLGITPHIQGRIIEKITVRDTRLRWAIPPDLAQKIEGTKVQEVLRRGKYLILTCERASKTIYVLIHLGMSGSLRLLKQHIPAEKHDHVDCCLDNGLCLRYREPRRFGCVLWTDDWQQHRLIAPLGVEPLSSDFSADYLYRRAHGKTQVVKNFLMDSHQVVGVGNIYASESLFMAKIHPNTATGAISLERYAKLVQMMRNVLSAAIAQGGTSLRDFRQSDGKPGYFKQALQVYGREGEPCCQCGTPIAQMRIGQRASYFCPQCQVLQA